jgi:hypothetical protein
MTPNMSEASTNVSASVSVDSAGVVHYNNPESGKLYFTSKRTVHVAGKHDSDGNCVYNGGFKLGKATGATGLYTEETSSNPATCAYTELRGHLTAKSAAALSSKLAAEGQDQTVPPEDVLNAPATAYVQYASTKGAWIDPVNLTITSNATNLGWIYQPGINVGYPNVWAHGYRFAYDGWSGGPPTAWWYPIYGTWPAGGGKHGLTGAGAMNSRNTDFEKLLTFVLGGPTVLGLCHGDFSPAVFNHVETIDGWDNGNAYGRWNDSKGGGCSNLVKHRAWVQFGTQN